ncbi:MAG: SLC13 family permease [Thermoflexales bacterium]|nr:SLC13 family permease [Thermoflexales bacterium]
MTQDILLVLLILAGAIVLFISEVIRMDLTTLIVLVALFFFGLVDLAQALSGFSNPAVIAVGAMFILSAGLTRAGVSSIIGKQILRLARQGEGRLVAVLITVTALLSSFMNNAAVAAMFLPITLEISRRTKQAPSRLLLPMAYGSLLGGLILLIGTSSNLVVRDVMREAGYTPLGIFDFTPGGLVILFLSVLYMALIGRRFLPVRQSPQALYAADNVKDDSSHSQYGLEERLATLILPEDSPLAGTTLVESRIGRALGLNILSIQRKNGRRIPVEPNAVLESGDRLLVLGRLERIDEISQKPMFHVESKHLALEHLFTEGVGLAVFEVVPESPFAGKTLAELNFRQQYDVNVLAIRQGEIVRRTNLQDLPLNTGDVLLIQGAVEHIESFKTQPGYHGLTIQDALGYHLEERLLSIRIPVDSPLIGHTLTESRLGAAYGLAALMIFRGKQDVFIPQSDLLLQADDLLVVGGRPLDIDVLKGLQGLHVDRQTQADLTALESGPVQIVEVMLSPQSDLAGKTLRGLRFREKYGVSVLAIWRGVRSYRSDLGNFPLQRGDALLCYGEQEKLRNLARERDFVVLKMDLQEKPRLKKAPLAGLIMAAVILAAMIFGLPISMAAIAGCVLMVISGVLSMDEAYQGIDWRSIFVIAAMLPLGIAMQQTGAAALLGGLVSKSLGAYGSSVVLAGLMVLTTLVTQFMPSAAVAVIMTPIALTAAQDLGIAPQAYVMGIAYAMAASFLSPVAHPANLLVMSPGGYRFSDYIRHGLPVTLIVVAVSVLLLPLLFPY